ncbi:hypothetical protein L0152_03205 [bacterium]|nr:hypothetical protein [bacterium]
MLLFFQEAKRKGNNDAAERELKEGYASAERLSKLNTAVNAKQQELENFCKEWRPMYGSEVDALLEKAEKEKNAKKRAETGAKLQKYQSLNSRLCVQAPNMLSAEWKHLRVESYDGPQEINQKVLLLKDISREMSIQLTRLDEQYKQAARERLTRDRAQEFIEEGTLFDGSVNVRARNPGAIVTEGEPTNNPTPTDTRNPPEKTDSGESTTAGTSDSSVSTEWYRSSDSLKTETGYKKQRSELVQQQEEIRKKIQEFEAKVSALIKN